MERWKNETVARQSAAGQGLLCGLSVFDGHFYVGTAGQLDRVGCVNVGVLTGATGMGLRWAREGDWRLTAYAAGGCTTNRRVKGLGWIIDRDIPADVYMRLKAALGIK